MTKKEHWILHRQEYQSQKTLTGNLLPAVHHLFIPKYIYAYIFYHDHMRLSLVINICQTYHTWSSLNNFWSSGLILRIPSTIFLTSLTGVDSLASVKMVAFFLLIIKNTSFEKLMIYNILKFYICKWFSCKF